MTEVTKFRQIPGLAKVSLGETIPSPSVNRADVADGTKGRAILITQDWFAVPLAYTEIPKKGCYYVTQESVLKYGLSARVYYIGLIARLNTGANGDILDDTFRLEYLRLSEDIYTEFSSAATENSFTTVALNKVVKGNFSYIKPVASNKAQNKALLDSLMEKIARVDVNAVVGLVLSNLARPIEEYAKALAEAGMEAPSAPSVQAISGSLPESFGASALPKSTIEDAQAIEVTDEFDNAEGVKDEFSDD